MEIIIKAKIPDRWVNHFCTMLKQMERLGNLGGSRIVAIYSDGDGDFRPKFEFDCDYKEVAKIENSRIDYLYDAG